MTSEVPSEPVSLLALFAEEAGEHISGLRSGVAALESSGSPAEPRVVLEGLRHDAHGVVGSAWAVGLDAVAELMQAVEVACVGLLRAGIAPSPSLPGAIADAVDAAEVLVGAAVAGGAPPGSVGVEVLTAAVAAAAGG